MNCYEGMSERTRGMTGKNETVHLAFPEYRAAATDRWPVLSTQDATHSLDMETDRLLYGDGSKPPWRPPAERIQCNREVECLATARSDVGLHKWQVGRGSGPR